MLAKLIKYDLKALSRFLIIIHIMLLAVATLGRFIFVGRLMAETEHLSNLGSAVVGIGILLFVLIFMAAVFGTLALVGIHFYRNLFSDEGYLTHTLPVSRGELLASKTLSGSLWILLDQILLILSIVILVVTGPVAEAISNHKTEILEMMGFPKSVGYGTILLAVIWLLIVSAISNAVTLYVSVVVGQLFSNHRALGAVVVYVCINTVVSMISGVFGASIGMTAGISDAYTLYVKLFVMSMGAELLTTAVFYVVAYILMQKKLNLN